KKHTGDPCQLPGFAVGLEKEHAEHVRKGSKNHEIGGPGVDGTNQPAKPHPGHDVLDAFEGLVGTRTVIQEQQDPGQQLDYEKKKGNASEEVPIGQAMSGDGLVAERGYEVVPIQSFIKPAAEGGEQGHASRFRLTTMSSPRKWTSNTSSGLGGGPETLRPLRS